MTQDPGLQIYVYLGNILWASRSYIMFLYPLRIEYKITVETQSSLRFISVAPSWLPGAKVEA